MQFRCIPALALAAIALSACITTSMQGYADREAPSRPLQRMAVLVTAPGALASSLKSSVTEEAKSYGMAAVDALALFPPTRTYNDAEIKSELAKDRIEGVLIVAVGDGGVRREYAGTFFYGSYSGTSSATGTGTTFGNVTNVSLNGTSSGTMTATATPNYRYSRQTAFQARLLDAASGRVLWVGSGQVQAGGLLFIGDGANANSTVAAIFKDLSSKGLIGAVAGQ